MLTNKGYAVLLSSISSNELESLKESLTVKPSIHKDYDYGQVEPFSVYRISEKYIYLPKFFGINHYGPPDQIREKEGQDISFTFKGQLKEHQTEFCDTLLKEIKENGSCIASAATGSGKTVIGLWLVSQLKKRTLIIVHKEFLMDQWIERIKQYLPNSSIGIIQKNKCEIDKDIVIGMLQTILSRNFPSDTFNSFGMMITDECHHMACKSFSQVLFKCKTKYTLGLSATPKRADGLTKVLTWCLGPIICNEMISDVESPIVKFIEAEYENDIIPKYISFKGTLNAPNLINQLVVDPARNKIIIDEIIALNKEGRKILVLSGRRDHCIKLEEMLKSYKLSTGLYMGGMKQDQLDKSNEADIIFATYQSVSEGYDNPLLNTLIMATGMGAVIQPIGRILRKKNKFRPLVIDVIDPEFFGGQARRRKQFYKKKGYTILGEEKKVQVKDSEEEDEGCLFD